MTLRVKRRLKSVKDPVQRKRKIGLGGSVKMTAAEKKAARLAQKKRYASMSEADKKFERERAKYLREKREGLAKVSPVLNDMQQDGEVAVAAAKKRKAQPGDKEYKAAKEKATKTFQAAKKKIAEKAKADRAKITEEKNKAISENPNKAKSITKKAKADRAKITKEKDKALGKLTADYRQSLEKANEKRNKIREKEGLSPVKLRGRQSSGNKTKARGKGRTKGALNKRTYTKRSAKRMTDQVKGAGDSPGERKGRKFGGKTYDTLRGAKIAETRAKRQYGKKSTYDPHKIGGKQTGDFNDVDSKKRTGAGRPKGALNKRTYTKRSAQRMSEQTKGAGDAPGERKGKKFNGKTYKTERGAKIAETRAKRQYGKKSTYDPYKIGGKQSGNLSGVKSKPKTRGKKKSTSK